MTLSINSVMELITYFNKNKNGKQIIHTCKKLCTDPMSTYNKFLILFDTMLILTRNNNKQINLIFKILFDIILIKTKTLKGGKYKQKGGNKKLTIFFTISLFFSCLITNIVAEYDEQKFDSYKKEFDALEYQLDTCHRTQSELPVSFLYFFTRPATYNDVYMQCNDVQVSYDKAYDKFKAQLDDKESYIAHELSVLEENTSKTEEETQKLNQVIEEVLTANQLKPILESPSILNTVKFPLALIALISFGANSYYKNKSNKRKTCWGGKTIKNKQ